MDVLLLFLRDRKMYIVIIEKLHTFAGGEVAVRWASRAASLPPFMYGEININLAMCHPAAPLDILGILKPDLTIGALYLVHHIPAQGAAILQRIPEVGGDGMRHDALLHRALEENAVGAVGAVRDDPAQRCHQRVREILGGILRSQIAHVKTDRLFNEFAAAPAVRLLQPCVHAANDAGPQPDRGAFLIVLHFSSFRCHRSKTPESPANAALLLRTDIGSSWQSLKPTLVCDL